MLLLEILLIIKKYKYINNFVNIVSKFKNIIFLEIHDLLLSLCMILYGISFISNKIYLIDRNIINEILNKKSKTE